jgi:EmrB/QacA subfamily drug resistance transporter
VTRQGIRRRFEASPRYPALLLSAVLFGLFTVGFTITILAVSVPRIAEELNTTQGTLTWIVTGPLLAFGVVGPTVGKLGDIYGHRRTYLIGLFLNAVFAALTAVSWNAGSIITFRLLGAAAGAAVGPASLAMINRAYPAAKRVQAMGFWSLVAAGGPVLGVVAGGPIVEAFGFRVIFLAQVPLVLASFAVGWLVLPSVRGERARFDVAGTVLLALAVTPALVALNRGPELGWDHPLVVAGFAMAPLAVAGFVKVEQRAEHPLIPVRYLRRRNFALPIGTLVSTNFAYMGGFFLTPLLLQNVLGYNESRTGLLSIARPLTFAVVGPVAGYLAVRVGERSTAVFGVMAIVASMIGLSAVAPGSSDLLVVAALALSGVGMGAASPAMAATIANAVDDRDLGVAGAAQQMMQQIGVVAGIQLMQTIQQVRVPADGVVGSYGTAYLVGGAVCALGLLTAAFVRNSRTAATPATDAAAGAPTTSGAAAVAAPAGVAPLPRHGIGLGPDQPTTRLEPVGR